jgi:hypothetical protein
MKRRLCPILLRIFILACCLTAGASQRLQAAGSYDAGWLETGCIAILVAEKDPESFTKKQEEAAREMICWLNGFMCGANAMVYADEDFRDRKIPPLVFIPDDWLDARNLAPQILEFIRKNKVSQSAKAREVMMVWYYLSHPKATDSHKSLARSLIETMLVEVKKKTIRR